MNTQETPVITLVSSVNRTDNAFGISFDGKIPWYIKEDLKFFKNLTKNKVVVVGRKTYNTLPFPLKDRTVFVLTKDKDFICNENVYDFDCIETLLDFSKKNNIKELFVIGGGIVYEQFINLSSTIFLTEVQGIYVCDTFFPEIPYYFEIHKAWKIEETEDNIQYRIIQYIKKNKITSNEKSYLDFCKYVLKNGTERMDRSGTGTISVFGNSIRYDISNGSIPLFTTKKVRYQDCIEEMLWMIRGETDTSILKNKGVNIWNPHTSRKFLDSINKKDYKEGILHLGYGHQIRNCDGVDQLVYIENLLKTDPFSRRILWNLWNVKDISNMVLQPCHYSFQLFVEEINGTMYLSGLLNMRSNDLFLGHPYNVVGYTVLLNILAIRNNMFPKDLTVSIGDAHIYLNLVEAIKKQLSRDITCAPRLSLKETLKTKDINDINIDDFDIVGYFHNSFIKGKMAI
jgi:dihydrofolate reductase/thymidylate synthase